MRVLPARVGFSLVEVLAALVLLGVGALALTAGSAWAARLLAAAERTERATALAALVLDSLAQVVTPGDGERREDGVHVAWRAHSDAGGAVRIELRFVEPAALAGAPPLQAVVGPPAPVLRAVPEAP